MKIGEDHPKMSHLKYEVSHMIANSLAIATIFLLLISLSLQTLQIFHHQKSPTVKNLLKIFHEVK